MITRRTLLGGVALGAVTPFLAGMPASAADAPPVAKSVGGVAGVPMKLPVTVRNRRTDRPLFAQVMGRDATGWTFLAADGRTPVRPTPSAGGLAPLSVETGIRVPAGGTAAVALPRLGSGRVFLSVGRPLDFFVGPDGGIATPSVTNPDDPNADAEWGFCEFTFDEFGLYANLTMVDFVALAVGLELQTASGRQSVGGLVPGGLATIAGGLAPKKGWSELVVRRDGRPVRVLSPNLLGPDGALADYLDPFIAQVWSKYRHTDLVIDTQSRWGRLTGRVGTDGRLRFPGVGSFARPSTHAVFNCSVAPFVTANDIMGNLSARLAAALNRGTLLANPIQPDASADAFYRAPLTNHYARLVHGAMADGAGYAFPYDDVHADGYNTEGRVVDPAPRRLTILAG
jgi:hypothetical protein